MKKQPNNSYMQTAIKAGLCLFALSGATPLAAQEETTADTTEVSSTRIRPAKKAPQYKMKSVRGVVYDAATGAVLSGVRVQAYGYPAYTALTEEDGSYRIEVPTFTDALYVDAPEYNPVQVAIKDSIDQNSYLHSNKLKGFYLPETSITARNKAYIETSSALSVETDIQNTLEGNIRTINRSGLPAQGAFMHIRGINSLNANTQPLFIIDGVMVDLQEGRTSLHEGFYNNLLAGIDPEDIESVEVLKNATALYGAKGANGVVLINTKRGRSMATRINVRVYGGFELKPKTQDMMNATQFRGYMSDLVGTIPMEQQMRNGNYAFLNDNPDYFWYPMYHNETDWSDDLYRTTFVQNYKVNVEGGDERAMYNLSLGYAAADATTKGTDFNRLNLRFNTDVKIAEKLNVAFDFSYNQMAYNVLDNGWSANYDANNIGSPNVLGLIQSPFLNKYGYYIGTDGKLQLSNILAGKYAADASFNQGGSIDNPFNYTAAITGSTQNTMLNNPYWILENGEGKEKNYAELMQFNINVQPRWQITKQLCISDRFSYTLNRNNERYYIPRYGSSPYYLQNLGFISSVTRSQFSKEISMNNDLRIEWGNQYGAHDIKVYGGWRYNNYSYSYTYLNAYNNANDKITDLDKNSIAFPSYDGINDNWVDMAYYANVDYNFRNKYFAQASVGIQSSSRFGKDTDSGFQLGGVSWGVFPSLQLGWLISSESWFPTNKQVNYLKLTAGVDQSGNDNLNYYATRTYWSARRYMDTAIGLVMENVENPKLQWETTTRYNVALEGSFLNNRLTAGLNLYWSKTDNLLVMKDISYLTGLDKYWTNEGAMTNRGYEVNANAILINKKNWKWELGASVGHYNNKITELPANAIVEGYNGYTTSVYGDKNILTAVGHAAGVFYGYRTNGVFASEQDAKCYTNPATGEKEFLKYPTGSASESEKYKYFKGGDMHFVDLNHDGIIDEADKTVIGDPNPDLFGNLFTSLSYKNLRLDVTFKYSLGNDVYNYQRSRLESGSSMYNQTTAVLNRWTTEGQTAAMPRAMATNSDEWVNNERFSDRWIEDGSYLKLKNVRLTYTIPISNTWLQGIKVWGEGNNLLTVSKYLGIDPESSCNNNILYQGIDNGLTPLSRSFNVGVTINL